jgi:hypothetical protein
VHLRVLGEWLWTNDPTSPPRARHFATLPYTSPILTLAIVFLPVPKIDPAHDAYFTSMARVAILPARQSLGIRQEPKEGGKAVSGSPPLLPFGSSKVT